MPDIGWKLFKTTSNTLLVYVSTMGIALSIQLAGRVGSRGVSSKQPYKIMLSQLRCAMCSAVENSTLLPGKNTFGTRLCAPCTLKFAVL
jgi:hypothetical protein